MKKILITGAYGFIGRNLSLANKEGNSIAGIGRGDWGLERPDDWGMSEWLPGDINSDNLNVLESRWGVPDVVYHCAGSSSVAASLSNPQQALLDTVVSTSALLEWVARTNADASIVVISSAAVYGSDYERPISQDDSESPISIYGTHKLMTEVLCRSYAQQFDLKVIMPRIFSVYGAGLRKQLFWDLCERAKGKGEIVLGGSGNEMRDWIDVRDLVKILAELPFYATTDAPVVNVASGHPNSVKEVAELICQSLQLLNGQKVSVTFDGDVRPGNPISLIAKPIELDKISGKGKILIAEGIADYVGWYIQETRSKF
ncbi:SDR family oxidoreductase [Candidatus Njordibacter sp. Uisw_056]|uniref:NAD-dependent epimerase/dehydratase family protein n=1 Tax=Candidatus Njordibacter sp. Uisw_056 TaxID=3230973 RepID=UPI003D5A687E